MRQILKNQLSSGEISRLVEYRTDSERNFQGCLEARNCQVLPQGGMDRRPGTKFIADISVFMDTVGEVASPPRLVPFTFNESQAYTLCFYPHSSGTTRILFATGDGLVEDSLSPGNPYIYEITGTFDHQAFDYAQSADTLFIAQPDREPLKLVRTAIDNWTVSTVAFVAQPADWSNTFGWPELVSFFEQRLVFASNLSRPQTLWFSKAGDFTNYDISSPVVDSDAITITLDSAQPNRIVWLSSSRKLLIGTVGTEWSVGGTSGPITPTNINASKETNQGSEKIKPFQIGPVTLFIEKHGRVVNQMAYDFNINGYDVVDLSILSPHLTRQYPLTKTAFQKDPGNVFWAVREDGQLMSLTYQRKHGVLAWTPNDTQGEFIDVTCIPGDTYSETWFVVGREVEGTYKYYLEKLGPRLDTPTPADARMSDCYIEYSGAATDTVSGLDHLEGFTVQVLGDGTLVPDQEVVSGEIVLPASFENIVVGLGYETDIVPIMPDNPDSVGPILTRHRKLDQVALMLFETSLFKLSHYIEEELQDVLEVTMMNTDDNPLEAIPLYTGIKVLDQQPFQDRETKILIRQDKPLPLTLLGVAYRVTVQEK